MTPMYTAQARNHRRIGRAYFQDYLAFGSLRARDSAYRHYFLAATYELQAPARA